LRDRLNFGRCGSIFFHCCSVSFVGSLAMGDSFRLPSNHNLLSGASLYLQNSYETSSRVFRTLCLE
jgi:hypothetical protein